MNEQEELAARMIELAEQEPVIRVIWDLEIYRWTENCRSSCWVRRKIYLKSIYGGVNLLFRFWTEGRPIFIDFVIFGTDVAGRRMAILNYFNGKGSLRGRGQRMVQETLLKVDNYYYRVFPMTKGLL